MGSHEIILQGRTVECLCTLIPHLKKNNHITQLIKPLLALLQNRSSTWLRTQAARCFIILASRFSEKEYELFISQRVRELKKDKDWWVRRGAVVFLKELLSLIREKENLKKLTHELMHTLDNELLSLTIESYQCEWFVKRELEYLNKDKDWWARYGAAVFLKEVLSQTREMENLKALATELLTMLDEDIQELAQTVILIAKKTQP